MTKDEFEVLLEERADLRFPPFYHLLDRHQRKILEWDRTRVIAERVSVLLRFGAQPIPAWDSLPDYDTQEVESPEKAKA